jgi:hypothetical protein
MKRIEMIIMESKQDILYLSRLLLKISSFETINTDLLNLALKQQYSKIKLY